MINTIKGTNFSLPGQTKFYKGKVRDVYTIKNETPPKGHRPGQGQIPGARRPRGGAAQVRSPWATVFLPKKSFPCLAILQRF